MELCCINNEKQWPELNIFQSEKITPEKKFCKYEEKKLFNPISLFLSGLRKTNQRFFSGNVKCKK